MSNASVIQRMRILVDQLLGGELSSDDFVEAIYSHLDALEGVDFDSVRRARDLCHDLIHAHLWSEEKFDEPHGHAEVRDHKAAVIADFRGYLDQLAGV